MTRSDKEKTINYEEAFQKLGKFIYTTKEQENQNKDCTEKEKKTSQACQHCTTPCK